MKRYEILIGLSDKDTYTHKISEIEVRDEFLKYFSDYKIDFSLSLIHGGYAHENGTYVLENTIKLTLIGDYENNFFDGFIESLKKHYNQEEILIISQYINSDFRS